eukprot:COSAG01_NODE_5723_length_4074_cov_49.724277_3_plen_149_part_00
METDHSLEPCGSGSKPSLRSRCTINRSFSFSSSESWRRLSWWPTYAPTTISPACSQGLQGERRSRGFVRAKAHHRAPLTLTGPHAFYLWHVRSPYGAHSGEREEVGGRGTVHARSHHPHFADGVAVAHDPEAEHRTVDLRRAGVKVGP